MSIIPPTPRPRVTCPTCNGSGLGHGLWSDLCEECGGEGIVTATVRIPDGSVVGFIVNPSFTVG